MSRGQWKEIYLMKTTLLWRIRKATARAEPLSGLNLVKITGPSFLNQSYTVVMVASCQVAKFQSHLIAGHTIARIVTSIESAI